MITPNTASPEPSVRQSGRYCRDRSRPADARVGRRAVSWPAAVARRCSSVALLDEVDEHVVAERLGRGEERPAAVHLRELLDERACR